MAMLRTVADFDLASDVSELKFEVKKLNQSIQAQQDINENLFCAIKNLTDVIRDQNELLMELKRKM